MAVHIPARAHGAAVLIQALALLRGAAFGVDRHHDALRAVLGRGVCNELRVRNRSRVETGLVSARIEQAAHVFHRAHAATHGQRNEDLRSDGLDDVQDQIASVAGGGDVQKGEFVRALVVVARRNFHGVTGVPQLNEIHALDDTTTSHIQAGNDAFSEHAPPGQPLSSSARACAASKSRSPL